MSRSPLDVRRRVLVLNHFAAPRGAPGGTRHVELFGRLEHWDACIVAARRNLLTGRDVAVDEPLMHGVWTSRYSANGPSRVLNWATYAVTALAAGLRAGRVDAVYGSSPHLLAALTAWLLARLRRVPFVLEVRDLWPRVLVDMGQMASTSPVYRALERLERFLYRHADHLVVLADGTRRALESEGVPAAKITVIPNGADPAVFAPPAPRSELRQRFGFGSDGTELVCVYAGAHGPANGLDLLLDAAAELRDELPQVRVVLVGDGLDKPRLAARVHDEHLTNVELRDPLAKSEMPALLGAADVGVHVLADVPLFRYGVSPNKLFDYLAAGLPVITNTGGDVAALVERAGAGLAVEPEGLAEGFRALTGADATTRRRWSRAGRAFMEREQSHTVLARRLVTVLNTVTGRR